MSYCGYFDSLPVGMFHLGRDISNLVWESSGGPPPFNLGRRILSYGNHRRNIIMFKKLKTDFVFVLLLIQKCNVQVHTKLQHFIILHTDREIPQGPDVSLLRGTGVYI